MITTTTVTDKQEKVQRCVVYQSYKYKAILKLHTVICSSAKHKAADRVDIKPWSSSTSLNEYETLSKEERWAGWHNLRGVLTS